MSMIKGKKATQFSIDINNIAGVEAIENKAAESLSGGQYAEWVRQPKNGTERAYVGLFQGWGYLPKDL